MTDELPFEPRDRAAYLPSADALVLADLHLGKGEAAAVELPLTGRVVDRLDDLLAWCDPGTVVLAGDVLHSFSYVSEAVADAFDALRTTLRDAGVDLRVVAGNHDRSLGSLCGEADDGPGPAVDAVDPVDAHRLPDGTLVCHGHEAPAEEAARYVVGHDHPAIVIEGRRRPCYLLGVGVYRDADVLALPAFNPLATGTAVNRLSRGDPSSPLLSDVRAFRPVVRDEAADETYVFPPLGASKAFL